jgi:signal transduction histidine kinase
MQESKQTESRTWKDGRKARPPVLLSLSFASAAGFNFLGRLAGLRYLFRFKAGRGSFPARIRRLRRFCRTFTALSRRDSRMPVAAHRLKPAPESKMTAGIPEPIADTSELMSFFTISHEIKAPVRAIDSYARIFLEDYGQSLDPEAYGIVENIRSICKETIALTNKLLEYTRIGQNEPNDEVVDLKGMIQEVFASLDDAIGDQGQTRLVFDSVVPPVIGDPLLLRQAMVNIISNSLKFARGKDEAVITVGCEKLNGEDVFFIRDNGIGFDMQYSEKLFGMFQRLHTSDEFEGSGIGLAIVKKIILLHRGRVWITGEVGRGATVYFTLPREKVLR